MPDLKAISKVPFTESKMWNIIKTCVKSHSEKNQITCNDING